MKKLRTILILLFICVASGYADDCELRVWARDASGVSQGGKVRVNGGGAKQTQNVGEQAEGEAFTLTAQPDMTGDCPYRFVRWENNAAPGVALSTDATWTYVHECSGGTQTIVAIFDVVVSTVTVVSADEAMGTVSVVEN